MMNRRQLLHAMNAVRDAAVLPKSTFPGGDTSPITPMLTPSAGEDRSVAQVINAVRHIPKIGVIAVGGMVMACLPGADHRIPNFPYLDRTIAIETSGLALSFISADHKILIGDGKTPFHLNEAEQLIQAALPEMAAAVAGLDMVFLVAGLGDRTGARIAPIVVQMLRHQEILTLGFAVMPLDSEGAHCQQIAAAGFQELRRQSHALIHESKNDRRHQNDKIRWLSSAALNAPLAFVQLCRSITNSVARADLVGIDFKDLQNAILSQKGHCAFGFGCSSGLDTATVAAQLGIDDPLLGRRRLKQASAALVTIEAPPHATMAVLRDAKIAMNFVRAQMAPNPYILYGVSLNPDRSEKFTVSILASGLQDD